LRHCLREGAQTHDTMTDDKEWTPGDPEKFEVEEVPADLKEDYNAMARLRYDDDVWKVLADAMAALKQDKFSRVDVLQERVSKLQDEVSGLKALVSKQSQDDDETKQTFG